MFKFLREKLRGFFKKSSEEIVKEAEIKEIEVEKEKVKERKAKEGALKVEKEGLIAKIKKKFTFKITQDVFENFWRNLETLLLENNVALEVTDKIKSDLQKELIGKEIGKENVENFIKRELKKAILNLLIEPFDLIARIKDARKPYVIVFFGINGSGKTTTIAKLAYLLQQQKLSCVFAASDTFRAASIEQLEKHASRLNVKTIKHSYGADAAAVAFDAISYAKAHSIDVVLIDTAGRMHTQANLMREMEKICRVTKPDLKIFIGEAIVGNDMIEQAKSFLEAVGIDAMILTKADVDEKGGAAISASYVTQKPILFLGTGQSLDSLQKFDPKEFIKSLGL